MALVDIQNLLLSLLSKIGEETQYDEVADLLEEIESKTQEYSRLIGPSIDKIMEEIYVCKGNMIDVKPDILEMLYIVDDLLSNGFS